MSGAELPIATAIAGGMLDKENRLRGTLMGAGLGASFGSGLVPGSGIRNEFSRLLSPQLKEVEQDFFQLLFMPR